MRDRSCRESSQLPAAKTPLERRKSARKSAKVGSKQHSDDLNAERLTASGIHRSIPQDKSSYRWHEHIRNWLWPAFRPIHHSHTTIDDSRNGAAIDGAIAAATRCQPQPASQSGQFAAAKTWQFSACPMKSDTEKRHLRFPCSLYDRGQTHFGQVFSGCILHTLCIKDSACTWRKRSSRGRFLS